MNIFEKLQSAVDEYNELVVKEEEIKIQKAELLGRINTLDELYKDELAKQSLELSEGEATLEQE